jgi:hypothetical protein
LATVGKTAVNAFIPRPPPFMAAGDLFMGQKTVKSL